MARAIVVFIVVIAISLSVVGQAACATAKITIREAQGILKELGYYSGEPDGIPGPRTLAAVKAFQKKNKLTVDGIIGPATSQALIKAKAALQKPSQPEKQVLSLQNVQLESFAPQNANRVALTFDDGPNPDTTPQILRLLKERNLKATFFVIGVKCERHPDLVKKIASEGHSVQNHSYAHAPGEGLEELSRVQGTIKELTGTEPTCFRPPGGKIPPQTVSALSRLGLAVVYWSNIGDEYTLFPGAVVKLNESKALLAALPAFLDQVVEQGYETVLLDQE